MNIAIEKTKALPFLSLYHQCVNAVRADKEKQPNIFDMMAIAYRESMGTPYADCRDCLSNRRLSEMDDLNSIKGSKFREVIRCDRGVNKGKVPKFLFDSAAYRMYGQLLINQGIEKHEAAMLCSGFGYALRFWTKEFVPYKAHEGLLLVRQFIADPNYQLVVLASDLYEAGSRAKVSSPFPFERLHKQHYRRNDLASVSGRTHGVSEYFRMQYAGVCKAAQMDKKWENPESEPLWRVETFGE